MHPHPILHTRVVLDHPPYWTWYCQLNIFPYISIMDATLRFHLRNQAFQGWLHIYKMVVPEHHPTKKPHIVLQREQVHNRSNDWGSCCGSGSCKSEFDAWNLLDKGRSQWYRYNQPLLQTAQPINSNTLQSIWSYQTNGRGYQLDNEKSSKVGKHWIRLGHWNSHYWLSWL